MLFFNIIYLFIYLFNGYIGIRPKFLRRCPTKSLVKIDQFISGALTPLGYTEPITATKTTV